MGTEVIILSETEKKVTSQNHGFAVNKEELDNHPDLEITHLHLNDGTVAGMRMKTRIVSRYNTIQKQVRDPMISSYLFDQFIENMKG
jgi:carbamoyl-phosphate synthase small subunit